MAPPIPPRSRAIIVRLGVVAAAIALGLALQEVLSERLEAIAIGAERDVVAARRELGMLMRAVCIPVLALTTAIGVSITHSARCALREARFPPTQGSLWNRGGRVLTGAAALRKAAIALCLGLALVLCSLSAAGLVWWITRVLLLCRA